MKTYRKKERKKMNIMKTEFFWIKERIKNMNNLIEII